jgi:hypothetical protein
VWPAASTQPDRRCLGLPDSTTTKEPLMSEPSACRHCGVSRREHFRRWTAEASWHKWVQPTQEQIKARMQARRAERMAPKEVLSPTPDLIVTITADAGQVINALYDAQGALMFASHPDLREPA